LVVDPKQTVCAPEIVIADGAAEIVTLVVAVASAQPPVPVTVYVIVAVPPATPLTKPDELTIATAVLLEVQAPPLTVELSCVEVLEQAVVVPEIVPAEGTAEIVTVLVAVASEHPPVPVTVYVIVAVPAATPVTTPDELTVAIAVFDDVHVPPETVEVNVVLEPAQIVCVPDRGPAEAAAETVTVLVATASEHPPVPVIVYEMVAVPAETPVTTPEASTVATAVLELDQVPLAAMVLPIVQFEEVPVKAKLFSVPLTGALLI
jgi:hypothetical protein